MADEITESPAASAAPASEAPAISPAVSEAAPTPETPAPSTSEAAPAVAPESPAAEPKAEAAPEAAKEPTSLLGEAASPAPEPKAETEAKPEEAKAEEKPESEAPAPEEAPAEAPLPTYDVFTVPEGVELEDERVDKFVGTLGTTERAILAASGDPAKIHAAVQQLGQQMLDHYTDEIAQLGDRMRQANAETFARTQENWKNEFFQDPKIGGNRQDTTLANVGSVVRRFGGTAQEIAELRSVMSTTGAGNHRLVLNLLNNIAEFLGEGKTPVSGNPEPQGASRSERRYGKR
jgi:hypothetical protein